MDTVDDSQAASYLNLPPSRIPRSASHDSFATELSLLSMSSFTSEVSRIRPVEPDDTEVEHDPELVRYRESMLEKMLETQAMTLPCRKIRSHPPSQRRPSVSLATNPSKKLTDSEECLIRACQDTKGLANKATLYKSFSMTDVYTTISPSLITPTTTPLRQRQVSQPWIPPFYAQISLCRRKHLEHLAKLEVSDLQHTRDLAGEMASTPEGADALPPSKGLKRIFDEFINSAKDGNTRSSSIENLATAFNLRKNSKPLIRKLRFSREIGKRIRDDLLQKLSKQKRKLVTKMDLERDKGRPVTKTERNFMIFHWLQSLDEDSFDEP